MRRKCNPQLNLFTAMSRNKISKELQLMSQVLDAIPEVLDVVYQELVRSACPTRRACKTGGGNIEFVALWP